MHLPSAIRQLQSRDLPASPVTPGPSSPSQMILLHALVTIVLSYQVLFSVNSILRFEFQELVVVALIISVIGLVKIPARYWTRPWLVSALVIADTLTTTAIIYSTGQASSGLYLAYFLIILIAAFAPTLTQMIWLSAVLCATYAGVLYLELAQLGTLLEGHLLQIPVLLILAMFYGVTIDAVRKLDREKTSLVVDLEEQKRVEQALRESKEHFEAFMDSNPAAAFMKDPDGRYIYANKPFEQRFGVDKAGWYGKTDADLWPAGIAQELRRHDRTVMTERRTLQFQETIPLPHLGLRSWVVLKFPLRDKAGHQFVGGLAMELTAREQLEAQFRQAQRLEVVGRLAGGVAHDFNNLLLVILGHCDLLLKFLALEPKVRAQIEEIKKSGERASALTRQLLAFSRRQMLQPRLLDLNGIVANVEAMLRRVIGEDIRLVTRLGDALGSVEVDPGQMDQVIMNLAINARDAMPEGGELAIETRQVVLSEPTSIGGIAVPAGSYVVLGVSDTGQGMDADTKARIFEPFFTTKEVGKGTGLGLSTVYGIVKQSGGFIFVESEVGRGSTFLIYLPQARPDAPPAPSGEGSAPARAGSETVLLIEDDAMVRNLLRSVLSAQGYRILEASSGHEALRLSGEHDGPIQLVITDMILPDGLNGREVAERLVGARPELSVLYMSGYTDDRILRCGVLGQDAVFLQKPFAPEVLADKVREVLDRSSRRHAPATAP